MPNEAKDYEASEQEQIEAADEWEKAYQISQACASPTPTQGRKAAWDYATRLASRPADAAIREPVRWFAGEMEKKLKANDWKRQWPQMSNADLVNLMGMQSLSLAMEALKNNFEEVCHRAINVGNYAMMLADNARAAIASSPREDDKEGAE